MSRLDTESFFEYLFGFRPTMKLDWVNVSVDVYSVKLPGGAEVYVDLGKNTLNINKLDQSMPLLEMLQNISSHIERMQGAGYRILTTAPKVEEVTA